MDLQALQLNNKINEFNNIAILKYMINEEVVLDDAIIALFDTLINECEARVCSKCNSLMIDGYCIDNGSEYYCTDECLESEMTREEFEELYDEGGGESYWTEWECSNEIYKMINEVVIKYPELGYKKDSKFY